ncbi:MAG: DUF3800 domain-containing protein [Nanoarchaeota archaeon]|nr:DUF3800 domain-containing protein [Nanoarchaeota archaeon]
MKFKYVYIDESGDLGTKGGSSKFLILSALVVDNPADLERIIKNMRRNKFKKELRKASEIKANKSSSEVIVYMLKKLNELSGTKVYYIVLDKSKIYSNYLKKDKHKLYNFVAGKLARNMNFNDTNFEIKIDKSKGNLFLQEDFNKYFENHLKENCEGIKCKIEHSWSHSWGGLQFADVLAWSCFQKFEYNNENFVNELEIEQEVCQVWKKLK